MPLLSRLSSSVDVSSRSSESARVVSRQPRSDLFVAQLLDSTTPLPSLREDISQGFSLRQSFGRLGQSQISQLESVYGHEGLSALVSISEENSSDLFGEALLQQARHLQGQDRLEAAARIYSALGSPGASDDAALVSLQGRARSNLSLMTGTASSGVARFEFLAGRIFKQAMDPAGLVGMAVAGPLFRATKLFALSRLASPAGSFLRPWAANALAGGLGFLAENVGFTFANRGVNTLVGRPVEWSGSAIGNELVVGALSLGSFRVSGNLVRKGLSLTSISAQGWGAVVRGSAAQAAMLAGILISRKLESSLGFRHTAEGEGAPLLDGLATLLQFNLANGISRAVFGSHLSQLEAQMEQRLRSFELGLNRPLRAPVGAPSFGARMQRLGKEVALAPLWMMMGSMGGSGEGEPPSTGPSAHQPIAIGPHNSRPAIRFSVPAPGMPGPKRLFPILGVFDFFNDPVSPGLKLATQAPGVTSVAANSAALVVIHGSELVSEVLTQRDVWLRGTGALATPPAERPHLKAMLEPMIFMNGGEWQSRRRVLLPPASRADVMADMAPTFDQTLQEVTGSWKNGDEIDLSRMTMEVTLGNNLRGLMGIEPKMGAPIANLMHYFATGLARLPVAIIQKMGLERLPYTPYARWLESGEQLRGKVIALIEHKRANPSADALGALVRAVDQDTNQPLTNDQVIGELTSFYAAGYESTARTIGWALWLMAHHPEVGQRAAQEVADVLRGEFPNSENVKNLSYLNDVIAESQRIIPSVPMTLFRTNLAPITLGGVNLPAHSNLTISIVAQHHNPKVFTDPGIFNPDRWQNLPPKSKLTYDFLPFGAGPRRCLGGVFAALQVSSTIARLLQKHAFVPVPTRVDYQISGVFTVEPKKTLPMRLAPLGGWRETTRPTGTITRLLYPSR